MTTLLAFVVAIAILVVFHELGHYAVARLCDVKVLKFSIGFGKALYTKRFGNSETEWVLSAIPLGGYVKMLDEREGEVPEHDLPRAFNRKPVLQRMAIVVAGPIANLLLAVILYFFLFIHGVPGIKPVLGEIAPNTPAAMAGLQSRQTIRQYRWATDAKLAGDTLDIARQGAAAKSSQIRIAKRPGRKIVPYAGNERLDRERPGWRFHAEARPATVPAADLSHHRQTGRR